VFSADGDANLSESLPLGQRFSFEIVFSSWIDFDCFWSLLPSPIRLLQRKSFPLLLRHESWGDQMAPAALHGLRRVATGARKNGSIVLPPPRLPFLFWRSGALSIVSFHFRLTTLCPHLAVRLDAAEFLLPDALLEKERLLDAGARNILAQDCVSTHKESFSIRFDFMWFLCRFLMFFACRLHAFR